MPHQMNMLPVSTKTAYAMLAGIGLALSPLCGLILHPMYKTKSKHPDRTIIVTGATGKIGNATAYHLAKHKCRVIMACRDMDKCKSLRREIVLETRNKSVVCRHLDLEDINSIDKFAEEIMETEPHIDVLINNAAVVNETNRELTKYGIEKNFFVNFLAPYLLTLKLMPKLEESAKLTYDSRVVNVIGNPKKSWHVDLLDLNFERRRYNRNSAYNQSKLALAYFSILLEKINRQKKNQVYVFGASPTAKRVSADFEHNTGSWARLKEFIRSYFFQDAGHCAQRAIMCALDPDLVKEEKSGRLYNWFLTSLGSNHGWGIAALNEEKAKLVWNVAANLLINAKEVEQPAKSNEPTSRGHAPEAKVPQMGDQLKLQENNKPSGADESA